MGSLLQVAVVRSLLEAVVGLVSPVVVGLLLVVVGILLLVVVVGLQRHQMLVGVNRA